MAPRSTVLEPGDRTCRPPDDLSEDSLLEMANLDEQDTGVPGIVFISTALGTHGPRVKWYPDTPSRTAPCLIMSIEAQPQVRDDFLPARMSRPVIPLLSAWVGQNHEELLDFWRHGETWTRRRVAAFLDALRPLPR